MATVGQCVMMLFLSSSKLQFLEAAGKSEDAAVAYSAAGALPAALRCYRAALQWPMAFAVAGRLGFGRQEVQQLAREISDELLAAAQGAEAAQARAL